MYTHILDIGILPIIRCQVNIKSTFLVAFIHTQQSDVDSNNIYMSSSTMQIPCFADANIQDPKENFETFCHIFVIIQCFDIAVQKKRLHQFLFIFKMYIFR